MQTHKYSFKPNPRFLRHEILKCLEKAFPLKNHFEHL